MDMYALHFVDYTSEMKSKPQAAGDEPLGTRDSTLEQSAAFITTTSLPLPEPSGCRRRQRRLEPPVPAITNSHSASLTPIDDDGMDHCQTRLAAPGGLEFCSCPSQHANADKLAKPFTRCVLALSRCDACADGSPDDSAVVLGSPKSLFATTCPWERNVDLEASCFKTRDCPSHRVNIVSAMCGAPSGRPLSTLRNPAASD
ncbi:hypothetical protein QBC39DRAFT_436283 [Podospora conica]|nr:hypothetical protein QBC39DRAFT_436283 [Schizothecium conicum]